ncbi:MAG: patatin-like phospholipase family protein [Hyphomicrobium sp.]
MVGAKSAFRILSLDGGGSWALLQVMALIRIYGQETRGHDVLAGFDLVAANSGGSLTLGGLLTDKPLSEILDRNFLDESQRRRVFATLPFRLDQGDKPLRSIWNRLMQRVANVGAKYRTEAKLDGLRALLAPEGDRTLSELHGWVKERKGHAPHFVIVGFDYDMKRAKFFRSDDGSLSGSAASKAFGANLRRDMANPKAKHVPTLAEAIHASSNAPVTFFMSPAEVGEERYWDGAIGGYNNPVLAAVTEALANRGRYRIDDIHVLSLGTGTVSRPSRGRAMDKRLVATERQQPTLFGDLKQLAMSILDDPPDSATFTTHVLLGQPLPDPDAKPPLQPPVAGTVVRMSPVIRPVRASPNDMWRLPEGLGIDDFLAIQKLELDAIGAADVARLVVAGELWLADQLPNQAIRETKEHECQVGHATFSTALAAWRRLAGTG